MGEVPLEQFVASEQRPARFLLIAIALCLLLQAWLATRLEINWDEFFYLSHIYDYQRGQMTITLQVLHVHILGWITSLPGNEIDQVISGRFFMLACLAATCGLIYALAREFFSPVASAMAVLAFATAAPTLIHGASFRADPIAAMFIMLSLVILVRSRATMRWALLAAASAAVAAMITIKVVLYAPAFIGAALWRLRDRTVHATSLKWLGITAACTAGGFALLYVIQLLLVEPPSNISTRAALDNTARTTIIEAGFLPRLDYIIRAAIASPAQTIMLIAGGIGVLLGLIRKTGQERMRLAVIGCCAIALVCLLFYRNAFPYFFPFIFPPAMLLIAWVVDRSSALRRPAILACMAVAMFGPAIYKAALGSNRDTALQRRVVEAVHGIFPEPVITIDRNHMISSFPKRGFFMSTWGIASYRKGSPLFADILLRDTVPLLLINSTELADAVNVTGFGPVRAERRLFAEDRRVLQENFIPHWGPLWVAGKRLEPGKVQFRIAVPGRYTLEGAPAVIDGKELEPGAIIDLGRGAHRLSAPKPALLRWGEHLHRPPDPPPPGPLFKGFL